MKKEKLYLIALTCQAIVVGIATFRLLEIMQQNDKPNIIGTSIWLVLSFIAFICFFFLFKRHTKNNS